MPDYLQITLKYALIILPILIFLFQIYQYVDTKKKEQNHKDFEAYHSLIKALVQEEEVGRGIYIDWQTSILYELTHFERYYEISYRTIIGLKNKWEKETERFPRLEEEADLTLKFL